MKKRSPAVIRLLTVFAFVLALLPGIAVAQSEPQDIVAIAAGNPDFSTLVSLVQENGFVETLRGRSGGLRLARPMEQISIGAVFRVFESGVPFAECFDAPSNTCPLTETCRLRNFIARAVEAFYHELDMVTLRDLVQGNCGLHALMETRAALLAGCKPDARPAVAA